MLSAFPSTENLCKADLRKYIFPHCPHPCLLPAVFFFFSAFAGTFLRFFARYCHQLSASRIAGTTNYVASPTCVHARPRAQAKYKDNGYPLVNTLLFSDTADQNLRRVPLSKTS